MASLISLLGGWSQTPLLLRPATMGGRGAPQGTRSTNNATKATTPFQNAACSSVTLSANTPAGVALSRPRPTSRPVHQAIGHPATPASVIRGHEYVPPTLGNRRARNAPTPDAPTATAAQNHGTTLAAARPSMTRRVAATELTSWLISTTTLAQTAKTNARARVMRPTYRGDPPPRCSSACLAARCTSYWDASCATRELQRRRIARWIAEAATPTRRISGSDRDESNTTT